MSNRLWRAEDQPVALALEAGLACRRRRHVDTSRGGGAELPREDRSQVGYASPACGDAVDVRLRLERKALPKDLEQANKADRQRVDVQMRLAALHDEPPHQLPYERHEAVVFLAADLVIFLPRGGLAPERVPDGDLARAGEFRIEVEVDEATHGFYRRVAHRQDRGRDLFIELCSKILQRRHHHGGLGTEVETHDAGREICDRDHLLDRSAGWPMDMQGGNARVDQALPLAVLGATGATNLAGQGPLGHAHGRPPQGPLCCRLRSSNQRKGLLLMTMDPKHSPMRAIARALTRPPSGGGRRGCRPNA